MPKGKRIPGRNVWRCGGCGRFMDLTNPFHYHGNGYNWSPKAFSKRAGVKRDV